MDVQLPGPAVITQNGDISYKAVVDGETIPCRFSTEALEDIDPANRMDDVLSLFEANKSELLGIAEKKIREGKIEDGKVFVFTADLAT